ncbi:MAG: hypothetical protein LH615_15670 [Ferruginibacter sp.]|nr:hypothetical protein [Ferruginibacter sp.]
MKLFIFCLMLFISVEVNAQKPFHFNLKEHKHSLILTFLGGSADGIRDASMFGNIRGGRWVNGDLQSWKNKYKNGNPREGAAFFGSTNVFVAFTDLPHAANFFSNNLDAASKVFMPNNTNTTKWQKVGLMVLYKFVQVTGHNLMYNVVFKDRRTF